MIAETQGNGCVFQHRGREHGILQRHIKPGEPPVTKPGVHVQ